MSAPSPGETAQHTQPGSAAERDLQCRYQTTGRADRFYRDQVLDHLNPAMREFVGRQDMAFIATSDGAGECDASFRAGTPGFLHVIDERTIAYPEYRGNGTARVVDDETLRRSVPDLPAEHVKGRQPERWVVVAVDEAYVHCRKHIPRMMHVPHRRAWGTDDVQSKGGDYFGAAATPSPWSGPPTEG